MYYTACLLLTIQWQLLCQAIVSLVGLLKIVWGGLQPQQPPPLPRSVPDLCLLSLQIRHFFLCSCAHAAPVSYVV